MQMCNPQRISPYIDWVNFFCHLFLVYWYAQNLGSWCDIYSDCFLKKKALLWLISLPVSVPQGGVTSGICLGTETFSSQFIHCGKTLLWKTSPTALRRQSARAEELFKPLVSLLNLKKKNIFWNVESWEGNFSSAGKVTPTNIVLEWLSRRNHPPNSLIT